MTATVAEKVTETAAEAMTAAAAAKMTTTAPFTYEYKDKNGNVLTYLQITPPGEGSSGKVTLRIGPNTNPEEFKPAFEACKSLARMLQVKFSTKEDV